MKKNAGRLSKKLFAAMMAGTMMTAMIGANVYATGGGSTANPQQNVTITKKITKEANVYTPSTSFTFTVEPATGTLPEGITAGPEGGVTFASGEGTITSTPILTDGTSNINTTVGTTNLTVHEDAFSKDNPGVYRYVVTETEGDYEGITYDTSEKYFDVFVNNTTGVYAYTFTNANGTEKADGTFTNDYTNNGAGSATHDITLEKIVKGNQGDLDADFEFQITINGATGEQYQVVFSDPTKKAITLTSGTQATIALGHNDTATIYGLSASDTYTITETAANQDGYDTEIVVGSGTADKDGTVSGTISADTNITVTNTRNASAPTGIAMTYGPYALMVALAGGMAVLFLRRRNREDY